MARYKSLLPILLLCVSLYACKNKQTIPPDVIEVINTAGANKHELLGVIEHFRSSPLKLKAAYYLIKNLKNQYHYEGNGINEQKTLFNTTDSLLHNGQVITNTLWDSITINSQFTNLTSAPVHVVWDKDVISSQFLIKNIDGAFISWQYPWARSMSFEQFCEYILPYKILDEDMDNWREECQQKYKWALILFKNCTDSRLVCSRINDTLKTEFEIGGHRISSRFDVTYSDLIKVRTGVCDDAAQYATYVMRAMGLPVSIDYCRFWANKNSGHAWCSLIFKGKTLPFEGCESNPGETKIEFTKDKWIRRKSAKILRHCFHNEIESAELSANLNGVYKTLLINTKIKDVTSEYTDVGDIRLRATNNEFNSQYIYLCVFNSLSWRPIYYSHINWFNFATFKKMAKDIVYIPMYIVEGEQIAAGPPFVFRRDGQKLILSPDIDHKVTVLLKSKYPEDRYEEDKANNIIPGEHYELFYWDNNWLSLGKQTATEKTLNYKDVPDNALLWLRDLDKGKQERIFVYKNNTQIWW